MANRITPIEHQLIKSPNYNMRMVLAQLVPSTIVPQAGKYYVFVYKAKTPNITYDQNPLIECRNVYQWGFTGVNVHWGEPRVYTFPEVISNMYEVNDEEFQTLINVPLARFRRS